MTKGNRGVDSVNERWAAVLGKGGSTVPPNTRLVLGDALLEEMVAHLRGYLPFEGAGLVSVLDEGQWTVGDAYYPVRNRDASPTRFTMDPIDVLLAVQDMEQRGRRLGAIVHSHPRTAAEPSPGDLVEATIPRALTVIVGFHPTVAVRAWRLLVDPSGAVTGAAETPIVRRQRVDRGSPVEHSRGGQYPLERGSRIEGI